MNNNISDNRAQFRLYNLFYTLGLILVVVSEYLKISLLIPAKISLESVDNISLSAKILLLVAILLAYLFNYFTSSEMILCPIFVLLVCLVEKNYEVLEKITLADALKKYTLLEYTLLIIASRKIDFRRNCRTIFYVSSAMVALILLSWHLGWVEDKYFTDNSRVVAANRYYLGFISHGFSAIALINLVFTGLYAFTDPQKNKTTPWSILSIFLGLNIFFFLKNETKLAFMTVWLSIVVYVFIVKLHIPVFRIISKLRILIPTLLIFSLGTIVTFSLLYPKNNPVSLLLDHKLNNRIRLNSEAFEKYPPSWFGTHMRMIGLHQPEPYFYVDSGYIRSLLEFGVALFFVILILYLLISYRASIAKDNVIILWVAVFGVYNIFNNLFYFTIDCSLLLSYWYLKDLCSTQLKYNSHQLVKLQSTKD